MQPSALHVLQVEAKSVQQLCWSAQSGVQEHAEEEEPQPIALHVLPVCAATPDARRRAHVLPDCAATPDARRRARPAVTPDARGCNFFAIESELFLRAL